MIIWLNPIAGIAGDMLLGALLDLGAPLDEVRAAVDSTGLTGYTLTARRAVTGGITATRAQVSVTDTATHRSAREVIELASAARPEPVARLATAALTAVAEVEADLHGESTDRVHLHELGGHDSVVDIVGVCAALHLLDVDRVVCGPLPLGTGTVTTRHGVLPVPAPATAALLAGAAVSGAPLEGETVTPTGAALLRASGARYGPPPAMTVSATGYGAGSKTWPDRPGILQAVLGTATDTAVDGTRLDDLVLLATNLDDVSGELLAYTIEAALAAGALDAWATPTVMKKGRPAHVLQVLAEPSRAAALGDLVLRETGSLGIRRTPVSRLSLPRRVDEVTVHGMRIRMKRGPHGGKPEHADVAAAAAALDLPLREVTRVAMRAAHSSAAAGPDAATAAGEPHAPRG